MWGRKWTNNVVEEVDKCGGGSGLVWGRKWTSVGEKVD